MQCYCVVGASVGDLLDDKGKAFGRNEVPRETVDLTGDDGVKLGELLSGRQRCGRNGWVCGTGHGGVGIDGADAVVDDDEAGEAKGVERGVIREKLDGDLIVYVEG